MRSESFVGLLFSSLCAFAVGCSEPASDRAAGTTEAMTTAGALHVSGAVAERLLSAFGAIDAVDHAMGGRASVDVKDLQVIVSSNGALDDDAPLFLVPITRASFDDAAESPAHRELKDPPQLAAVLFDAIAAVDGSLTSSGMGVSVTEAASVSCEGRGPGAGDDPNHPPPRTATCTVTSEIGRSFTVDGAKALRIVQGFLPLDAVDHAMGGRFSVDAGTVSCERRSGHALGESDPELDLPQTKCRAMVAGKTASISDAVPHARALMNALLAAGLEPDSAMGTTGVASAHVTCKKGPGAPTTCALAR